MKNSISVKKILILAANPLNTVRLSLEREVEEIRNTLQLSANRDRFQIEPRGAVNRDELQHHLFSVKPWIVQFSGHGVGGVNPGDNDSSTRKLEVVAADNSPPTGLVFEDENGRSQLVSGTVLANLFALFSKDIVTRNNQTYPLCGVYEARDRRSYCPKVFSGVLSGYLGRSID
jgi:hypothetical protein